MNMTLEQLLTIRSSRDLCHKEMDLNMELAAHLNKVQTDEAIRQARVHGATAAYALQKAHKECLSAGVPGNGGGKVGLPSLHGGLWSGHGVMLAQELGGTAVPPKAPYWQCATSCPSWDVGYHPVVGHERWRTSTCSSHPKSAGDASTTNWHKMLALFLRPRCAGSKAGRRGNSGTQLHSQRASLPKKERVKTGGKGP